MAALWSLTEIWPRKGRLNLKGVTTLTEINYKKTKQNRVGDWEAQLVFMIIKSLQNIFALIKSFCFYLLRINHILATRSLSWLSVTVKHVHLYQGGHSLVKQRAKNQIAMKVLVY